MESKDFIDNREIDYQDILGNKDFLDDVFQRDNLETLNYVDHRKQSVGKSFQRTVSTMDFYKLKNELYMHLLDEEIFDYFDDVISAQKGRQSLTKLIKNVSNFRHYKSEYEAEVDDYSFIALRRLRLFTELNSKYLSDFTAEEKKTAKYLHEVNTTASNFIGHTVMNNHLKRDVVIWARSDYNPKLKKHNLIKKDAKDQPYLFFLYYKKDSDYPSSEIVGLDIDLLSIYDPTDITKVLGDEFNKKIGDSHLINFWDAFEFFDQGIIKGTRPDMNITIPKRIDLRTPQQRLKFLRTYFAGMSQTQLAEEMKKNFGVKINQKNIEYWEKSKSEIPPFFKGDNIEQMVTIFVNASLSMFQITLNKGDEPPLSKAECIKRVSYNIRKFPNETMPSDFTNQLTRYNTPTTPKTDQGRFNDAVRRYGLEQRMNKKSFMSLDDVSRKRMTDWFFVFANISEFELLKDMSLVYDNDKNRAKVYNLWHRIVANTIYPDRSNKLGS
tara:strand:+ start:1555 stop:3042 length:1488 start_codon:yes stop_codon:yes gene_type:complete